MCVRDRESKGEKTIPPWPKNQIQELQTELCLWQCHSSLTLVYIEAWWDVFSPWTWRHEQRKLSFPPEIKHVKLKLQKIHHTFLFPLNEDWLNYSTVIFKIKENQQSNWWAIISHIRPIIFQFWLIDTSSMVKSAGVLFCYWHCLGAILFISPSNICSNNNNNNSNNINNNNKNNKNYNYNPITHLSDQKKKI